jgi:predicted 3-demethylubiquinone-9 3-methyltransferase (glyoxalase superfamily)
MLPVMAVTITAHLMFDGGAEEAMNLYVSVFPDSAITDIDRYTSDEVRAGAVRVATLRLAGQKFICLDSPVKPDFTFTPSISLHVDCETPEQAEQIFARLAEQGTVLLPLDDYGFSRRFGWVQDRFGVFWQLNLA